MPKTAEKIAFLEEVCRSAPEYAEVLAPFRGIYSYLQGREGETGISFALPTEHLAQRIVGGLPLLTGEQMTLAREECVRFLDGIVRVLQGAGKEGGEYLEALQRAIHGEELDLASLFVACFSRERRVIDEAAVRLAIPAPLLEFVLETALKTALERVAETVDPAGLDGWKEGYCPICGSRAGMAELAGDEGRRHLCCSACFHRWPYARLKCPYCGNDQPDKLSYFAAGDGPTRVDTCGACSRYLKTRDSRLGHADVPLEVEDLATIHLDLLAAREGFERGK